MTPLTDLFPPEHLLSRYLNQEKEIVDLYPGHFQSDKDWESVIQKRMSFPSDTRKALHSAMVRQNSGISAKTDYNLEQLAKSNTVVIVTGQQAGFFGGPLYTLVKTLSAIKWAEELSGRYPKTNFIPVFWLEVEDHDFKEIAIYQQPEKSTLVFPEPETEAYFQISARQIPESFSDFLDQVITQLPETDFKADMVEKLRKSYQPGDSYASAFLTLARGWFADYGLLVLNPSDPEIKRLALPLFTKELTSQLAGKSVSIQTKSMVDRSIPVQLTPRTVNLFMIRNGKRLGLELISDNKLKLAGTDNSFTVEQVISLINENPGSVSPNVVTRPLFQDTVLPTVGVILGPGEFSYWGQLKLAYNETETVMPLCIPRTSGVFVEPAIQRLLEKFGKTPEEIMKNPDWSEAELKNLSGVDSDLEFRKIKNEFNSLFADRLPMIKSVDSTLEDTWNGLTGRTVQSVEQFFSRLEKSVKKSQEVAFGQMKRLDSSLMPEGKWQERSVSGLYFLVKYGPDWIKDLYSQVTTEPVFHIFRPSIPNKSNRAEEKK
ncbi:MAG: bacillithiol biosynthesis cysteine-adding enzyme BshC [Bacteroidetes bacterium]|nr:bacillithiol biosynthesis cysteine-adding enzyme BshC [Bacteroidota bacterium]